MDYWKTAATLLWRLPSFEQRWNSACCPINPSIQQSINPSSTVAICRKPAQFRPRMKAVLAPRPQKVGMISLGCAKNLVDAEIMLGGVVARGYEITADADEADVLIVNTCAFIDSAKEESIEA